MTVYPFETKECSKCNLQKFIGEFGKCNKSKWGIRSACKVCLRHLGREYAKQKRASMSDVEKQKRAQGCKDWRKRKVVENSEYYKEEYYKNHGRNLKNALNHYYKNHMRKIDEMQKWRQNNPDKMVKAVNNWRKNNPIKLSEGHKKWMKENAEYVREYNRKRRAMKRQATIQKFNLVQLNQRMSIFGYKCAYCGGPFEHVDHVKPLSKGGPHCLSNLRPACAACNLSKHNKTLNEWLQYKAS